MIEEKNLGSKAFITKTEAIAFSIGTSIGWGSFFVTSNTYLPTAGPLGSILGLLIGLVLMIIVAYNYHIMMNRYIDDGGSYTYLTKTLGHDYGFVVGWFLILSYFAVLWANVTSIPLFLNYFIGPVFQFWKLYTLFGYDIYFGEILITVFIILILFIIILKSREISSIINLALIGILIFFILGSFLAVIFTKNSFDSYLPSFANDSNKLSQVMKIAVTTPWTFIGFESISCHNEEFKFDRKKSFSVLVISLIITTSLYIALTLLSCSAYPARYSSWIEYTKDLKNLSGLEALPIFYAAKVYLGNFGVTVLIISLFALILTSIFGNIFVLSKLFIKFSDDKLIPNDFKHVNKMGVPYKSVLLILITTIVIQFVGRTAVGWIVDVTSITSTIAYGFVCFAVFKMSIKHSKERIIGLIGSVLMTALLLAFLLPSFYGNSTIDGSSFFLFTLWGVSGFILFAFLVYSDEEKRFFKSTIAIISLLCLIFVTALIWLLNKTNDMIRSTLNQINLYYSLGGKGFSEDTINKLQQDLIVFNVRKSIFLFLLFILSISTLIFVFRISKKREKENRLELRQVTKLANTDPLTGVKNKLSYHDFEETMNYKINTEKEIDFAVVVCDVNNLKGINDINGHEAGDIAIRRVASTICNLFKHSPVFRIGGDEFAIILQNVDFVNRDIILKKVEEIRNTSIKQNDVTFACGIAVYDSKIDKTMADVFNRADELMYKNKEEIKKAIELS